MYLCTKVSHLSFALRLLVLVAYTMRSLTTSDVHYLAFRSIFSARDGLMKSVRSRRPLIGCWASHGGAETCGSTVVVLIQSLLRVTVLSAQPLLVAPRWLKPICSSRDSCIPAPPVPTAIFRVILASTCMLRQAVPSYRAGNVSCFV